MRNVIIDCFGNRNDLNPERFNSMSGKKHSHLIDEASETVTYIAFDHAEKAAQPGGTSVAITDADFPLGYVTVSGGTAVVSIESFTPPMAVFIKAGTCSG